MLILLEEDDLYKKGDEMLTLSGWHTIPDQWWKNGYKFSHKDDNTFSRHKILVRRKVSGTIVTTESLKYLSLFQCEHGHKVDCHKATPPRGGVCNSCWASGWAKDMLKK